MQGHVEVTKSKTRFPATEQVKQLLASPPKQLTQDLWQGEWLDTQVPGFKISLNPDEQGQLLPVSVRFDEQVLH